MDYQHVLAFDNYQVDNRLIFGGKNYDHFMSESVNNRQWNGSIIFILDFLSDTGHDINLMGAINNISFTYPSFPLLTQAESINEDLFCDENSRPSRCQDRTQCPCIHRLKIKLNATVELIIVDETPGKIQYSIDLLKLTNVVT